MSIYVEIMTKILLLVNGQIETISTAFADKLDNSLQRIVDGYACAVLTIYLIMLTLTSEPLTFKT